MDEYIEISPKGKQLWQRAAYDTSWDWIMPVWHKCREIGLWMSTGSHSKLWIEKSEEIQLALLNDDTPKRASKLISNLIKWYNSQNS